MTKTKIKEMIPVKKWLSLNEAMNFLDMGKDTFLKTALENRFTVSAIGAKKYYRVDELQDLIEENIYIKQS